MSDIIHKAPADHEAPLAPDLRNEKTKSVEAYEDLVAAQPAPATAKQKQEQEKARERARPSASELRAALDARTEQISRRVDAIQQEVGRVPGEVRQALRKNPLLAVGGSLAGGLLVGLLIGGIGKRKSRVPAAHHLLVGEYLDALADDVKHALRKGEDVGHAIKRTVGKYTPLVVVNREDDDVTGSPAHYLRAGLDMAFKTMLGFGVKLLVDKALVASGLTESSEAVDRATDDSGSLEVTAAVTTD